MTTFKDNPLESLKFEKTTYHYDILIIMRIGINLLPLRPGKNGGMEIYVRNLLSKLLEIDSANEYYLITAPYNDSTLSFPQKNIKKTVFLQEISLPLKIRKYLGNLFGQTVSSDNNRLENIINKYQIDLWFCPFLSLDPRPLKIPSLVTIPDIQHEFCPEYFSDQELVLRRAYIKPSCEMATEVITISEFSKQSMIEKLGIDPEKIHVIHLAAGPLFSKTPDDAGRVREKYHLPEGFFFYPANNWPHKNHLLLLMGYYLYRKKCCNAIPLHLVLSGSGLQNADGFKTFIAQNNLQNVVHILDYIDREDIPSLYKNANSLVFPSMFEGFGIPLLESMAMECPIIASDMTSIPEVAGNAAYLFDPRNPQSICDAMCRIVDDSGLRHQLIENGKVRVSQYSYENVARKHLALFVSAHEKKNDATICTKVTGN